MNNKPQKTPVHTEFVYFIRMFGGIVGTLLLIATFAPYAFTTVTLDVYNISVTVLCALASLFIIIGPWFYK